MDKPIPDSTFSDVNLAVQQAVVAQRQLDMYVTFLLTSDTPPDVFWARKCLSTHRMTEIRDELRKLNSMVKDGGRLTPALVKQAVAMPTQPATPKVSGRVSPKYDFLYQNFSLGT